MARRVSKKRARKAPDTTLTCKDVAFPAEKRIYLEGVYGIAGLFLVVAYNIQWWLVGPPLNQGLEPNAALYGKWWIPLIILAYPYAAWQVANVLAVRPRRKLLKQAGPSARVLNKSHPRLKAVLAEQARLLGLPEPEMYVLHDDAAYMYSMPGKGAGSIIITTNALLAGLDDDEIATMIAREMGHALCNHVRMAFVLEYMRHAPAIVRILLFPITALSVIMKNWLDLIESTADRVAVVVMGRAAIVNEAVVKAGVITDPTAEITSEEVDAFLAHATDLSIDAAQIERHYKMGEFLNWHPHLRDRIEEIRTFPQTEQGEAALLKMEVARQKLL